VPVLLGALLVAGPARAEDARFVPVTAAQAQALGIQTQRVGAGSKAAAAGLPATVSIPNSQVRVIAAPLAGVVESLETAPGLSVTKGQVLVRLSSPRPSNCSATASRPTPRRASRARASSGTSSSSAKA
jgi:acetyl/propionyl-CoA carboxylase alpha subunit